jgi:hypothetical protein
LINCKIWEALLSGRSTAAVADTEKPTAVAATKTGAITAGIQRTRLRFINPLLNTYLSKPASDKNKEVPITPLLEIALTAVTCSAVLAIPTYH